MMKTVWVIVVTLGMLWLSSGALAASSQTVYAPPEEGEHSAGHVLLDVFFLRPLGFAGTVVGATVFVVSLPISLPTRSAKQAAQLLVVDPAQYTFVRPLGDLSDLDFTPRP